MILDRLHVALMGSAVLISGFGAWVWHAKGVEAAKVEATLEASKQSQAQIASLRGEFQKELTDRDAQYKQDTANLQKQFQGSLSQIIAVVQTKAALPVPLQIVTPVPTAQNPNPAPTVIVPNEDLIPAKEYVQSCEQCKLGLNKAQADLATRDKDALLAQQQIDLLKQTNSALATEAKGGNWKQRTVRALKWLGIGALAGGAAICGSGHCKL